MLIQYIKKSLDRKHAIAFLERDLRFRILEYFEPLHKNHLQIAVMNDKGKALENFRQFLNLEHNNTS